MVVWIFCNKPEIWQCLKYSPGACFIFENWLRSCVMLDKSGHIVPETFYFPSGTVSTGWANECWTHTEWTVCERGIWWRLWTVKALTDSKRIQNVKKSVEKRYASVVYSLHRFFIGPIKHLYTVISSA